MKYQSMTIAESGDFKISHVAGVDVYTLFDNGEATYEGTSDYIKNKLMDTKDAYDRAIRKSETSEEVIPIIKDYISLSRLFKDFENYLGGCHV